jgi:hypothetical protein
MAKNKKTPVFPRLFRKFEPWRNLANATLVAGERVGQDSRHENPSISAIIELGTWRQSTVDGL